MSLEQVIGAILASNTAGGLPASQPLPAPEPVPAVSGPVAGYGPEQLGVAAVIVEVGQHMGAGKQGIEVALATAMRESKLKNLDHGDRDSLGVFQQRSSMGWGTPEQITTPAYAAGKFYEKLLEVPGWQGMALTDAADAVQKSAFPDAYAEYEQAAREIAAAFGVTS